jgi:hypothetical protein
VAWRFASCTPKLYLEVRIVVLEIYARRALTVQGPDFETPNKSVAFVAQRHHITIGQSLHHAKHAAEQPSVRFVIELNERKDLRTIKFVAYGSVLLPTLPLSFVVFLRIRSARSEEARAGRSVRGPC